VGYGGTTPTIAADDASSLAFDAARPGAQRGPWKRSEHQNGGAGRPRRGRSAAPGVAWGGGGIGVRRICLAHKPDDEAILGVTGLWTLTARNEV